MMAEKILALTVAFLGGGTVIALLYSKMIDLALRHSPRLRMRVRQEINRLDRVGVEPIAGLTRTETAEISDGAIMCAFGRSIPWTEICTQEGTLKYEDRFGVYNVCGEHARTLEERDQAFGKRRPSVVGMCRGLDPCGHLCPHRATKKISTGVGPPIDVCDEHYRIFKSWDAYAPKEPK